MNTDRCNSRLRALAAHLCDAPIVQRSRIPPGDSRPLTVSLDLTMRPLEEKDYHGSFLRLLNQVCCSFTHSFPLTDSFDQLTDVGDIPEINFRTRLSEVQADPYQVTNIENFVNKCVHSVLCAAHGCCRRAKKSPCGGDWCPHRGAQIYPSSGPSWSYRGLCGRGMSCRHSPFHHRVYEPFFNILSMLFEALSPLLER